MSCDSFFVRLRFSRVLVLRPFVDVAQHVEFAQIARQETPAGLGVLFTTWRFDAPLIAAGAVTVAAVAVLWTMFHRNAVSGTRLIPIGALYLLFAAAIIVLQHRWRISL